jgi:hypothetical protein
MVERVGDLADISHDLVGRQISTEDLPQRIVSR